jgi:hypothetical protein
MKPIFNMQHLPTHDVFIDPECKVSAHLVTARQRKMLMQNPTARKLFIRNSMFHSLLHWEALNSPFSLHEFPTGFAEKPINKTMRFKKPIRNNQSLAEKETFPRAITPDTFINVIQEHKWLESEKHGQDIGLETAIKDWVGRFGRRVRVRT